jgi:hypothetical protein
MHTIRHLLDARERFRGALRDRIERFGVAREVLLVLPPAQATGAGRTATQREAKIATATPTEPLANVGCRCGRGGRRRQDGAGMEASATDFRCIKATRLCVLDTYEGSKQRGEAYR